MSDIYGAIDLGYSHTKLMADGVKPVAFPSVTGTPDHSAFALGGEDVLSVTVPIEDGEREYFIGDSTIKSRFSSRQEDRDWIHTPEYLALLHAALSHITGVANASATIVTGLPIGYYKADKEGLIGELEKMHVIKRGGRPVQKITIDKLHVIPQGMGVAIDMALNEDGSVKDALIAEGDIGIIDIGGKTTNLLHAHKMSDISAETSSIDVGAWDAIRAIKPLLQDVVPGVDYKDHQIAQGVMDGYVKFKGQKVPMGDLIKDIIPPMAEQIVSVATQLWTEGGAHIDAIVIAGGGASIFANEISALLAHGNTLIPADPSFSNVRGYFKLAMRAKRK